MIAIINKGPQADGPGDERTYELRINNEVIGTFRHFRRDGLAECLRKAAECADEWHRFRLGRIAYQMMEKER